MISIVVIFWGFLKFEILLVARSRENLQSNSLTSLLDRDCSCRSLFTIGACGPQDVIKSTKSQPKTWVEAANNLFKARTGIFLSIIQSLHTFSKFLPDAFEASTKVSLDRLSPTIPYVPCGIRIYNNSEIAQCLKRRFSEAGRALKIAFVGDSQVRSLMEKLVMELRVELNFSAAGKSKQDLDAGFLNDKTKHMFPVHGDGLELKLYWSAELGKNTSQDFNNALYQGARDILEGWSRQLDDDTTDTKDKDSIPDIIYFDDGMWSITLQSELDALDSVFSDYKKLSPTFKKLATRSLLLLRTQTPMKHYLATKTMPNFALDIMNNLGWLALNKTGVWIWDTISPYYLREFDECRSIWSLSRKQSPPSWGCGDYQHPSRIVESVSANMIWNIVCNRLMETPKQYCCS